MTDSQLPENSSSTQTAQGDAVGDLSLAGDFSAPTQDQWQIEVQKVLNRGRPPEKQLSFEQCLKRLTVKTVDGLTVVPMYQRDDAPDDLGVPGVTPFRRGTTLRNGSMDSWDVRALHEDPDAEFTRKAVLTDLERGATSVWLRIDDDAIKPADLAEDLKDVLLDLAKVEVSSRGDQVAAAEALLAVFEASDKPKEDLHLNLGIDPIGFAAINGGTPDLAGLSDWVRRLDGYTRSRAITIDGTVWHNAGAGDVAELGWLLAAGAEYVRALIEQGVSADDAFDAINFRVTATHNQFLTIARLRALRVCWARVGEVFGVSPEKRGARQEAVTSWRELTREDPYVNMLRGTISTFAAAVGGAEAITTLPFCAALGLPADDFPRRIARNTGIILAEEANIGRVNDPGGGSFAVESLTTSLAEAGWAEFQKVEALGGMSEALTGGHVRTELDTLNEARAQLLATRKQPITSVSEFPLMGAKTIDTRPFQPVPERGGLAWHRDSEIFEALVDRSSAGGDQPKVFMACLGSRRDFGAREGFSAPVWHIAGIQTIEKEGGTTDEIVDAFIRSGAKVANLCSSAKVYATQGMDVAKALKDAGASAVYLSGAYTELGDDAAEDVFDGRLYLGMNVVEVLGDALDKLGVEK